MYSFRCRLRANFGLDKRYQNLIKLQLKACRYQGFAFQVWIKTNFAFVGLLAT